MNFDKAYGQGINMNTYDFVKESNRIEGIMRAPTAIELEEHQRFMHLANVTVQDLQAFVKVYQPNAVLRDKHGLDVRVGNHFPPLGGYNILQELKYILKLVNGDAKQVTVDVDNQQAPFLIHCQYETLHPFTDGNGRSGRVLWAWQMQRHGGHPLGFLHHFYYQALQAQR